MTWKVLSVCPCKGDQSFKNGSFCYCRFSQTLGWRQKILVSDTLSSFASPVSLESQSGSLELLEGQRPDYLGCFTLGPASVI